MAGRARCGRAARDSSGYAVDEVAAPRRPDQVDQRVECPRREHHVGPDVRVCPGFVSSSNSGDIVTMAAGVSPSAAAARPAPATDTACGIAGQHDLVGFVTFEPQPLVGVLAVVERLAHGVLRDHPVVHHQHGAVGELRQRRDQPAVRVARRRSGTPRRAWRPRRRVCRPRAAPPGTDQLRGAVRQRDGGANGARRAADTRDEVDQSPRPRQPRGVATDGQSWPDRQQRGQREQPSRDARTVLDDSTGAPSLTGNFRGLAGWLD